MPSALVHLQVFAHDVAFEACLNDIPIVSLPAALDGFDQQIPVNQFLIPRYNRLNLWVGIRGKPTESRTEGSGAAARTARVTARLVRYRSGRVDVDDEEKLLEVRWAAEHDPDGTKYPIDVGGSVDLGSAFGTWAWQSAAPLVLTDALREEARVLLENLRAAVKRGDGPAVLDMLRINFDEVGKAYGATDDAKDIAGIETFVARYAPEPERVLPLDPRRFDFRVVAGDKMLETVDEDWSTSVRFLQAATDQDGNPAGDVVMPYSLLLARVGDALRIVR